MSRPQDSFHYTLTRQRIASPTFDGPQEALVHDITDAGMRFTIPDFSPTHLFGPAPWPRMGGSITPAAGTRCLVVFTGPGTSRPWVLSFWPS